MNRSHIYKLLASVGILMSGPLTHDAMALARAIECNNPAALECFAAENPQSVYAQKAFEIAINQKGRGSDGNNGAGTGGGIGNNGKGKNGGKGNANYLG